VPHGGNSRIEQTNPAIARADPAVAQSGRVARPADGPGQTVGAVARCHGVRNQGPIGRPGTARPIQALTPCMPCSVAAWRRPRSVARAQRNGRLGLTVIDRWIPLVTAACGTWVARPASSSSFTIRFRLPRSAATTG
jgi:hypothetical protein